MYNSRKKKDKEKKEANKLTPEKMESFPFITATWGANNQTGNLRLKKSTKALLQKTTCESQKQSKLITVRRNEETLGRPRGVVGKEPGDSVR